ncbi:DUF4390 domain-containing protein [Thioalkalicoccus limnaeus]|uniref:DUF4390 domain-containing protein n=1 Tax=Thioalkalicoccus limnaeus TaxID=120681 RepID=A0ABV4BAG1_9GAMM
MTRRQRLVALVCVGWLLAIGLAAPVAAFQVERASTQLIDGTYWLDAFIDFRFTDQALEALENGVPLTIALHTRIRRKGARIWEESLFDQAIHYTIRYKPLSERYSVEPPAGGEVRSFVTRDAALRALGTVSRLRLISNERLDPDSRYQFHLRVSLDIDALPLPLRPMAYLRPSWRLHSGWSKWPLEP